MKYKIIKDHKVRYKDESGHYHQLTDQLVITWSSKRAEMDMINRERQIRKAEERIKKKKKPENKKGANRYIATDGDIQMQNELQKEKTKVATADRAVRDAQYEANLSKALNQHRAAMEVEQSRNRESLRSQINEMASDLKDQIRDTLSEVQKQLAPAPEREE